MHNYSICPLLGVFFSFASVVLLAFILIGNIRPVRVLREIYFLQLTTDGLNSEIIPGINSLPESSVSKLRDVTQYTVGLWNFCYGNKEEITNCAKVTGSYHFALVDIFYDILGIWVTVVSPGDLDNNNNKIQTMSKTMLGLYLAGIVLSFLTLVFGFMSIRKRRLFRVFTALLSFLALVVILVASALATGLYLYIKNTLNDNQDGIDAHLGCIAFGISWAAGLSSLIAFMFTVVATCILPERSDALDSPAPEKQPFLVSETSYQAPLPNTIQDPATVGLYHNTNYNSNPNDMFSNNNNYHPANDNQFVHATHYNN